MVESAPIQLSGKKISLYSSLKVKKKKFTTRSLPERGIPAVHFVFGLFRFGERKKVKRVVR